MAKRTAAIAASLLTLLAAFAVGTSTPASAAPVRGPVNVAHASNDHPVLDFAHKAIGHKGQFPKGMPTVAGAAPRALTTCISPCMHYAGAAQGYVTGTHTNITPQATGVTASYSVASPVVSSSDQPGGGHSLAEIAVFTDTGSSSSDQTVEVGWSVSPGQFGDSNPHLFTFIWVNGVPQCYNGCAPGTGAQFTPVVGCSPCAGAALTSDVGTSKQFSIQYLVNPSGPGTSGWYVGYGGSYFGAWLDTIWTSLVPSVTFTTFAKDQLFGELAGNSPTESCSDIGTGDYATSTVGAFVSSYTLYGTTEAADLSEQPAMPAIAEWNLVRNNTPTTVIRYGGPGWDSVGYGIGYKGTCAGPAERDPGTYGSLLTNREYCPDGATTTGCNAVIDLPYASDTINVIHVLATGNRDIVQAWGKYGSSGKAYYLCDTSGCVSGHRVLVTNALKVDVKNATGMRNLPTAYERAS